MVPSDSEMKAWQHQHVWRLRLYSRFRPIETRDGVRQFLGGALVPRRSSEAWCAWHSNLLR